MNNPLNWLFGGTVAVSAMLVALAIFGATAPETRSQYDDALNSVVKIEVPGTPGLGAGVLISPSGYILTNRHVVHKAETVTVTGRNGSTYDGTVLWASRGGVDVALVKVNVDAPTGDLRLPGWATVTHAPLRCDGVNVGETVYAVGHPLGKEWSITFGYVSGFNDADGVPHTQLDVTILPGNSGGGLFDKAGRLVGLPDRVSGVGLGALTGQAWAVPGSTLCSLLALQ